MQVGVSGSESRNRGIDSKLIGVNAQNARAEEQDRGTLFYKSLFQMINNNIYKVLQMSKSKSVATKFEWIRGSLDSDPDNPEQQRFILKMQSVPF